MGRWRREFPFLCFGWISAVAPNGLQPRLEGLLEDLGIFGDQRIFLGNHFVRPGGGVIA
jgi:hypothetical protein